MSSEKLQLEIEKAKANEIGMKWKKAAQSWLKAASMTDTESAITYRFNACDALLKKEGVKDFLKNVGIFEECIAVTSSDEIKKKFATKLVDYINPRLSLLLPKEDEDERAVANEKLGTALEIAGKSAEALSAYKEAAGIYLTVAEANLILEKKKNHKQAADCLAAACRSFKRAGEDREVATPLSKLNTKALEFASANQVETALHFLGLYVGLGEEKDVLKLQLEVAELLRKNGNLKEYLSVADTAGNLALKLADKQAAEDLAAKLMDTAKELFESKRGVSYDCLILASQLLVGTGQRSNVAVFQADHAKQFYTAAGGLFGGQDRERAWNLRDSSVKLFTEVGDLKRAGQLDLELGALVSASSDFDKAIELFRAADSSFKKGNLPGDRLHVMEELRKHVPALIANKKVDSSPFSSAVVQILQDLDEQDKLGDFYSEMASARFEIKDHDSHLDLLSKTVDQYLKSNKEKARVFGNTIETRTAALTAKSPGESLKLLDLHIKLFESIGNIEPSIDLAMSIASSLVDAKHYSEAVSSTERAHALIDDTVPTYWVTARNLFNARVYTTAFDLFSKTKEELTQKKNIEKSRQLAKELEQIATTEEKSINKEKPSLKQEYINLSFSIYESLSLVGEKGDLYLAEARRFFEDKIYDTALRNYKAAADIYADRDHSQAASIAEIIISNAQGLLTNKKYDEANLYFTTAAMIYSDLKDPLSQAKVYAGQGIGYLSVKRFEEGLRAIEDSTRVFINDNKYVKAGEVYQQAGQTLITVGQELQALEMFTRANNAFLEVKDKKKVISLGEVMLKFIEEIAKPKKQKELFERYFETLKEFYTSSDLQEQLGDLYVTATRRALDLRESRDEVTRLSEQAAHYYGTEHGEKIQPIIDVFVEYTKKYLEEEEYAKSAELSEQAVDMLLDAGKDEEAADLAAKQSVYLIKKGAVDPGIGVLEKAASLFEMLDMPLKTGEALFEGAKVLVDRDQFATSLANISRAVAIYEEHDQFDRIKEIANQCVLIAEELTAKNNNSAAKLYIDQSAELYELPGMAVDMTATAIYSDYTDKILDSMSSVISTHAMKRRRKKKRKRKAPPEE